ncbi:MAG TPA: SRPBCC family protein [Candidatus Binataceae bacterium]|nr:SRPBCC family protein [Candidatus Binataceae bacterium]
MNFEQRCVIPVAPGELWRFLMDVPQMATCVPGVENVTADGNDQYRGALKVKLGPISITLNGMMTIQERDEGNWRAVGRAEGNDRRIGGGARVTATMSLVENAPNQTEMLVQAEVRFLGKLGEFGEPLIRKQADATVAAFARNVAARFETPAVVPSPGGEQPAPAITPTAPPEQAGVRGYPWIGASLGLLLAIVALAVFPMPAWISSASWTDAAFAAVLTAAGALAERGLRPPASR